MQKQITELRLERDKYKQRITALLDESKAQSLANEQESRVSHQASDLSSKIASMRAEKRNSELRLEAEISDLRRKLGSLDKQRSEELEEQETRLRREINILTRQLAEKDTRKFNQEIREREAKLHAQHREIQ